MTQGDDSRREEGSEGGGRCLKETPGSLLQPQEPPHHGPLAT